jgi:hypothetical protein
MRERTEFTRQTWHGAGDEADLGPGPVFAVIAVGEAKLEGDVIEAADLPDVVSKPGNLLLALLGLNLAGRQRRQLGGRSAGSAHQDGM